MKILKGLLNKETAMSVAKFMEFVCYVLMFILVSGAVMSLLGRQEFILHSPEGTFDRAIYSEKDHNYTSRMLTTNMSDDIHVTTNNGNVEIATQIGLSVMFLVHALPVLLSFYCLSRVFRNIAHEKIFTKKNAFYLLYYGLLQMFAALIVPFLKLFICFVTNLFTQDMVQASVGRNIHADFIPNLAFIVAAYIIYYGIQLQDEADHTL